MAGLGAFGALALGVLYVAITMEQPRRRKRGTAELQPSAEEMEKIAQDFLAIGSIILIYFLPRH